MATTFRVDLRAALLAILEEQKTATPNLLRKVEASRPGAFHEVPCAYIGGMSEQVTHTAGTRTRTFAGAEIVLVDAFRENGYATLDELVDKLMDRFTDNRQRIGNAIIGVAGVSDTEIPIVGETATTYYPGAIISLGPTSKWEGRQ